MSSETFGAASPVRSAGPARRDPSPPDRGHVEAYGSVTGFRQRRGRGALNRYHPQDTAEFVRVLYLNVLDTMLSVKHAVRHLVRVRLVWASLSPPPV